MGHAEVTDGQNGTISENSKWR